MHSYYYKQPSFSHLLSLPNATLQTLLDAEDSIYEFKANSTTPQLQSFLLTTYKSKATPDSTSIHSIIAEDHSKDVTIEN